MKYLIVVFLSVVFLSCNEKVKKVEFQNIADINLILENKREVDTVIFASIDQTISLKVPYSDTIRLNLERPINDLY